MKRFLFFLLTVFTLSASAQTTEPVLKFGFLSYDTIIQSMDDYAFVESGMQALQEQYAAEQKRVEDEFNKKYEEFLDGQRDFPQTILQKRQMEFPGADGEEYRIQEGEPASVSRGKRESDAAFEVTSCRCLGTCGQQPRTCLYHQY